MKGYCFLLKKRLLHNKLNIILLTLLLIVTFGSLYLNKRTTIVNSQINLITIDIKSSEQHLKAQKNELFQLTGKNKLRQQKLISEIEKEISNKKRIITELRQHQWQTAYTLLAKENKQILRYEKNSKVASASEDFIESIKNELLIFQYLAVHNFAYESVDFPTKGLNFLAWSPIIWSRTFWF